MDIIFNICKFFFLTIKNTFFIFRKVTEQIHGVLTFKFLSTSCHMTIAKTKTNNFSTNLISQNWAVISQILALIVGSYISRIIQNELSLPSKRKSTVKCGDWQTLLRFHQTACLIEFGLTEESDDTLLKHVKIHSNTITLSKEHY